MRAQFRYRIRLVLAGVLVVALLILVRLYIVQIAHGAAYSERAERQSAAAGGLFDRGAIYFTRKDGTHISAATLATGFLVAINPQTVKDPGVAYAEISAVASSTISRNTFFSAARKKGQLDRKSKRLT